MIPQEIIIALQQYWQSKGQSSTIIHQQTIGGGSINNAFKISTKDDSFFVKFNSAAAYPKMFTVEYKGLQLLRTKNIIKVPEPLFYHEGEEYSCLLLEYIESNGYTFNFWRNFAEDLAHLHQQSNMSFGLDFDNYMGSLPQSNKAHSKFTDFFINERLEPQLKLAHDNSLIQNTHLKKMEKLFLELPSIFPEEKPALVHGDLWSGNFMRDLNGKAVIIDPATYFGHREVDIAMTTMFGGFSEDFYDHYQEAWPMEAGWQDRLDYYKLYPILIHINLFGSSYLSMMNAVLKSF